MLLPQQTSSSKLDWMMSSETSTDASNFRPWHLFALVGLVASTVGVVVVRPTELAVLVLLVFSIWSAAFVGLAIYRALLPLVLSEERKVQAVDGRTRAAIEREKTLVLRSIKELEFDRAMNKVSKEDFSEMVDLLRARALALMKQLDVDRPVYQELIEKELAKRLRVALSVQDDVDVDKGESTSIAESRCLDCGTTNDSDARFCKGCGSSLMASI